MDTLFSSVEKYKRRANAPLAVRVRPCSLDEFIGQEQAIGPNSWLRYAIENDSLSSVILYGPAGTGKTTLARIIANTTHAEFVEVSAVSGTVKDLRVAIDNADHRLLTGGRKTILFIDEIHRFNRKQQDALLHAVEDRTVILIGATTENPYFEVNTALLSRSRIVELSYLSDDNIKQVINRALTSEEGLQNRYHLDEGAMDELVLMAAGDARSALTSLELAAQMADSTSATQEQILITVAHIRDANPRRGGSYDKAGDMHYDIISAFIKSMRGSDPDAALYWMARMLDSGEDPKFIARRIMILASEDIGNADPDALLIAHAAFKACEVIGMPECRINLAQAAIYMALAPKSNSVIEAIDAALHEVCHGPQREVPNHLRDRHRPGSESYGTYLYPHNYESGWVDQQYLPDGLTRGQFWQPGARGWEAWRHEGVERDRM